MPPRMTDADHEESVSERNVLAAGGGRHPSGRRPPPCQFAAQTSATPSATCSRPADLIFCGETGETLDDRVIREAFCDRLDAARLGIGARAMMRPVFTT